jgi:hypothetical protein
MKSFGCFCFSVFDGVVADYHVMDSVDAVLNNPYVPPSLEYLLYLKCWVDAVQWHLEDLIRDPALSGESVLSLKRRIDRSNQERTNLVEQLDDVLLSSYSHVTPLPDACLNTESPAWAIDRLSILSLKIYHMGVEADRGVGSHSIMCRRKLGVLLEQKSDLILALDQLLSDISCGMKVMKVYRQMKMYNDPSLNPVLYKQSL